MKQSLHVAGSTDASGGGGGAVGVVRMVFLCVAVVAVLAAAAFLLGQLRETVSMTSNEVRAAQARESVAEANYRTAQLARDTKAVDAQAADAAAWQPWVDGAGHLAMVALLAAVPVGLVGVLVAVGLLFRRHVSLPTVDGRVPIVGLDRELSREALARYQELIASRGATWSPLPAQVLPTREPSRGEDATVLQLNPEER